MSKFPPGNPGGPGRPRGSRNKRTLLLEKLAHDSAPQLVEAMVREGIAGNAKAADIVLSRIWPERRGAAIDVGLPAIEKPQDLVTAQAALMAAVSRGDLSAREASSFVALLESQRRAFETLHLEGRVASIEAHDRAKAAPPGRRCATRS